MCLGLLGGSTSVKSSGWMGPCARGWMELRMRVILISWLLWLATSSTSKHSHHTHTHTRAQKHTHACTHLLAPALRASGKLESLVDWGKGEEEKTWYIETLSVDGKVIHFIPCLWSHQGRNDVGDTVSIMWHRFLEIICISLLTFTSTNPSGTLVFLPCIIMDHCSFSISTFVFTFWLEAFVGLTHFICFQWLKITSRDAVCTWRILVTVPLS